ncbi:hypothetical protein DL771_006400 [Monosporascus sp. 5C6A]|nr:hypothetical protein DL771_006400 [Monosporascus sp. 5C6A]
MEPQNDQLMSLPQQEDTTFDQQRQDSFTELRELVLEQERLRAESERLRRQVEVFAMKAAAEREQKELAEQDQRVMEEEFLKANAMSDLFRRKSNSSARTVISSFAGTFSSFSLGPSEDTWIDSSDGGRGGGKGGGGGGGSSDSSFLSSRFSLSSEDSDSDLDLEGDSSDSDSDSSDSDREKRRKKHDAKKDKKKRKEKKSKKSKKKDSTFRWKRFDFALDKENYLKGFENWGLWKNALDLALEEVGYEEGMKLSALDELHLAKAITKITRRASLELITGIKKGTKMLKTFQLSQLRYDRKDPVSFTTKFQKLIREAKECGMKLGKDQQVTMFLTAVEEKASDWCRMMNSVLRKTDYTIHHLMDNFNSEFHHRVKKAKGDRDGNDKSKNQSHNAKGRNNGNNKGRNNNNNGNKPSWNAKGEPLCWNCGKYGHLSKDCRKPRKDQNNQNRNQNGQRNNGRNNNGNRSGNNDGLEDLYNLPAKRHQAGYAAAVDQSDMAEIMQLFDRAMEQQRQTASLQGTQAPEDAAPEGVASGGSTPGVSTPCSNSPQHPEFPEEIGSTKSTGTSKKLFVCAPNNAAVDELELRLKNKPQEARALILQLHNVQKENRNEIL